MNALISEGFGIVLGDGVNFVAVTAMANLAFPAVGLLIISVATSTAEDLYSIPTTLCTVAVFSMLPRVV